MLQTYLLEELLLRGVDRLLEDGAGLELHAIGSGDLDLGAGSGVLAFAGSALGDDERAEANELDGLDLLDALGDRFGDGVNGTFSAGLGAVFSEDLLDFSNEFSFVHGDFWVSWLFVRPARKCRNLRI